MKNLFPKVLCFCILSSAALADVSSDLISLQAKFSEYNSQASSAISFVSKTKKEKSIRSVWSLASALNASEGLNDEVHSVTRSFINQLTGCSDSDSLDKIEENLRSARKQIAQEDLVVVNDQYQLVGEANGVELYGKVCK